MTSEEPKQTRGESGLGFSNLSMNEIAPATTAEPSEAGARSSKTWLLVVGVLAVMAALILFFQVTVDRPPSAQVQEQVKQSIAAEPYGQDGTVMRVDFLSGTKVRVDFTATLSTESEEGRAQLRNASVEILKKLIPALPDRDIFLTGFQGEEAVVQARYLHRSALVGPSGEKALDISAQVKGDPEGGISGTMGSGKSVQGR